MRRLYNAALAPLRAAAWLYGAWPRGTEAARRERDQRLGRALPAIPSGAIWIHGASVGEARLVAALAGRIKARGRPVAVSAVTSTGRSVLPTPPAVDGAFVLPLDFPGIQRRAFDALAPGLVVLVETELWPNLIAEAERRGIPVALVNARIAPKRHARYRRLAGLYEPLVRGLALVAAPSEREAERFRALGAAPDRTRVVGNLKFDLPAPAEDGSALRRRLGLAPERPVVVAGSTGAGEDAPVLEAFAAARRQRGDLMLVLAPRHPERFDAAAAEAARRGFAVHRLSSGRDAAAGEADVVLVDALGRLAALYALGSSGFVGGSLVPVGGHNLLEPVAAGSPVLFGPHTGQVDEVASALLAAGAGERVDGPDALAAAWLRLAGDPRERDRRAAAGRALLEVHRGALDATVALLLACRAPEDGR